MGAHARIGMTIKEEGLLFRIQGDVPATAEIDEVILRMLDAPKGSRASVRQEEPSLLGTGTKAVQVQMSQNLERAVEDATVGGDGIAPISRLDHLVLGSQQQGTHDGSGQGG